MVDELNKAWTDGIQVPLNKIEGSMTVTVRLALSCVACDIPAMHKACGFLGHRATLGCNKCFKAFEQVHENDGSMWTNYSGFDQTLWERCTKVDHMERCQAIKEIFEQQGTKASLQRVESTKGLRYSILLDLPYFDPIRYPVVDPMHTLFLGTGKHMMEVWLAKHQLISRKTLDKLEILISEFTIPEGIGHLPTKITSHFGGFTADQWRNWITIYSPNLRNCWLLFVQAVRMITGCILSQREVNEADSILV